MSIPDPLSLADRAAVITGAARGLGAATAEAFLRAGASVTLLDVSKDVIETRERLAPHGQVAAEIADVTDREAVEAVIAASVKRHGSVDVLVNNAGVVRDATLGEVTDEQWDATMDVNLRGAWHCAQAVVPHMRERGFGRILSASSIVARSGNFGQTAYAASKAGIVGLTRVWARELGPRGITANAVAPGFIETEMVRSVPAKVVADLVARTPAGRMGRPEEVANVYLFLASELGVFHQRRRRRRRWRATHLVSCN